MNKNKKRKMSIIVIAIVTVAMLASIFLTQIKPTVKNDKNKDQAQSENSQKNGNGEHKEEKANPNKEFRVLWAFADIDKDFMIQVKDKEDGDKNADYVFVKFTNEILDDKSKNSALNVANYKLDGQPLPKGASIIPDIQGYDTEKLKNKITIKLPNGYLKGVNAPHTLEFSKEIKSKYSKPVTGDLKITLSYSKADEGEKTSSDSAGKGTNPAGKANIANQNKGMPKCTLEIGKSIPYTTLIVASLDTKTPEKYKVSIEGHVFPLKSKKTGEKVFIDVVDKDYTEDQVRSLIKIEKTK